MAEQITLNWINSLGCEWLSRSYSISSLAELRPLVKEYYLETREEARSLTAKWLREGESESAYLYLSGESSLYMNELGLIAQEIDE